MEKKHFLLNYQVRAEKKKDTNTGNPGCWRRRCWMFVIQSLNGLFEDNQLKKWFGHEFQNYRKHVQRRYFSIYTRAVLLLLFATAWLGLWV
ncbi:MAG: hypothetical protein U5R06_05520 [candidate division KSB1 bacterium]|nr:hypothetical protein [candidate division KSB1 bacterium]